MNNMHRNALAMKHVLQVSQPKLAINKGTFATEQNENFKLELKDWELFYRYLPTHCAIRRSAGRGISVLGNHRKTWAETRKIVLWGWSKSERSAGRQPWVGQTMIVIRKKFPAFPETSSFSPHLIFRASAHRNLLRNNCSLKCHVLAKHAYS